MDILALDRVQKKRPLPDEAVARLKRLKLIEGRKPNLHVSAAIAAMTSNKTDYIRTGLILNKGSDRLPCWVLAEKIAENKK